MISAWNGPRQTLPHRNQLIYAYLWGSPAGTFMRSLSPSEAWTAMLNWQDSSHTTLIVDHGVVRLSISLSWIMLISLLIVQDPTTKGTLRPKSDSGTTRNTASSSYPAIPRTCTCKMTNLSGLVHIPPNPTRFTQVVHKVFQREDRESTLLHQRGHDCVYLTATVC